MNRYVRASASCRGACGGLSYLTFIPLAERNAYVMVTPCTPES